MIGAQDVVSPPALIPQGATGIGEQRRADLREMVRTRIQPLVDPAEETQDFPREVCRWLGDQGYLSIGAPVSEGGQGGGRAAECVVVEELTRASAGIAMSIMPFFIVRTAIWDFARAEAIEQVGKPMIRGERIVGIAVTEPSAGSDVAALKTTAVPDGTGFRLAGSKMFTTNGTIADDLLVVARTNMPEGRGMGLFLMSTDQPGFEARKLDKDACRASDTAAVFLDGCFVPAERVVGDPIQGFKRAMHVLNGERILSAARALALAEGSWEAAHAWSRVSTEFGLPAGAFEQAQAALTNAACEIWLMRLAIDHVCRLWDSGADCVRELTMLKAYASERGLTITRDMQLLTGAAGLDRLGTLARNARDARLGPVGAGSVQVQHRILARLLGLPNAVE